MLYIPVVHSPTKTRSYGQFEAHAEAFSKVFDCSSEKDTQIGVLEVTSWRRSGEEYLLLTSSGMVAGRTKDINVIRQL